MLHDVHNYFLTWHLKILNFIYNELKKNPVIRFVIHIIMAMIATEDTENSEVKDRDNWKRNKERNQLNILVLDLGSTVKPL